MKDKITAVITLEKVRYYNQLNNFGIICANVIEADEEIQKDKYGKMIVKGIMPEPQPGIKYKSYKENSLRIGIIKCKKVMTRRREVKE